MNIVTAARRLFLPAAEERAVTAASFGPDLLPTSRSAAGKSVTPETSLEVSTVMACVRILSDSISTLPVDSNIRVAGVRKPYKRPTWMLFERGHLRKTDVLGQVMVSLLLYGNAYVATYRDESGAVAWLQPLDPTAVSPRMSAPGLVVYDVSLETGRQTFSTNDILHIRGMTLPGELEGVSPITYQRETLGLSLAAQEYGAAFFGNGALPGAIITAPGDISPNGRAALREGWSALHRGSENAGKVAVLTNGASFQKVTVDPEDAQFLETRKFQINDIARIYGVPVNLLQHSDGPEMGKSLSDKNTHFVQHTLRPWVERLEEALSWLLHSDGNVPTTFVKFNLDGLMRGDHSTRFATYNTSVVNGILTINEVRAMEDLPPVPWGDEPQSVQVQPDATESGLPPEEPDEEDDDSEEEDQND